VKSKKDVLRLLHSQEIPVVLVGGLALRIYSSPRVTPDMDLVIRSLDVDRVIEILYANDCRAIRAVDARFAHLHPTPQAASEWVDQSRSGSLTFVQVPAEAGRERVLLREIDITTEVDILFDLGIPFARLRKGAVTVMIDDVPLLVASPRHLLQLKRDRPGKTSADMADIAFLEEKLARERRG